MVIRQFTCILILVSFCQSDSDIVINKINIKAHHHSQEYVELKYVTDLCNFRRQSNGTSAGPSLDGYYLAVVHAEEPHLERHSTITIANFSLSGYRFRANNTKFVIGGMHNADYHLLPESYLISGILWPSYHIFYHLYLNHAVLLLHEKTNGQLARLFSRLASSQRHRRRHLRMLREHLVDMVVYRYGLRHTEGNKRRLFEDIYPGFKNRSFLLIEQPFPNEMDITLSKCGTMAAIRQPFVPGAFYLEQDEPWKENLCNGIPFWAAKPHLKNADETWNDYTIEQTHNFLFHGSNRSWYSSPMVDWLQLYGKNCSTAEELYDKARHKFDNQTATLVCKYIEAQSEWRPAVTIRKSEVLPLVQSNLKAAQQYLDTQIQASKDVGPAVVAIAGGFIGGAAIGSVATAATLMGCAAQQLATAVMSTAASAAVSVGTQAVDSVVDSIGDGIDDFLDDMADSDSGGDIDSDPDIEEFPESDENDEDCECATTTTMDPIVTTTTTSYRSTTTSTQTTTTSTSTTTTTTRDPTTTTEPIPTTTTEPIPADAECFMRRLTKNIHMKGIASSCGDGDDGDLQQVHTLIEDTENLYIPHVHGVQNVADLVLSRGDGIFYKDFSDTNTIDEIKLLYVCKKHFKMLTTDWYEPRYGFVKQDAIHRSVWCGFGTPPVDGITGHKKRTFAKDSKYIFVTKQHSEALWHVKGVFYPIGTPLCKRHWELLEQLRAEYEIITKGFEVRPPVVQTMAESPQLAAGPMIGGSQCSERSNPNTQDVATPTDNDDSYHEPSQTEPPRKRSRTEANEMTIWLKNREDKLRDFANAAGVTNVNVARFFQGLRRDTKRKRAAAVRHLLQAITQVMASDKPEELERLALQPKRAAFWESGASSKLDELLTSIAESYKSATSGLERVQILSLVSPLITHSKLEEYIPGLTQHYFKKSRLHARRYGAGRRIEFMERRRIRYDPAKVQAFIAFITSPAIVFDLPFGTRTVKQTSGQKETVPNIVRSLVNERIVDQYNSFLRSSEQYDALHFSRSSMLRILHYCTATTRKSLHGLDYYSYAGTEAFDNIVEVLSKLNIPKEEFQTLKSILYESKHYLKIEYKLHLQPSSTVPDHCTTFALTDDKHPLFTKECDHDHNSVCEFCDRMKSTLRHIQDLVTNTVIENDMDRRDAIYTIETSITAIHEWKAHQLRTIHQDKQRVMLLESLAEGQVYFVADWSMKWLPTKGREDQTSWFGKRGISYHTIVAYMKHQESGKFLTRKYIHVFNASPQSSDYITAIVDHVIAQLKREIPQIHTVFIRSDNAGCYKSSSTIATMPYISSEHNVLVKQWDFSEAQSGKGPCDRLAGVIKRHLRRFVDENNSVQTATEFIRAIRSYNGLRGVSTYECELQAQQPVRSEKKRPPSISGISSYNNFLFTQTGEIIVWRMHDIGKGMTIPGKLWKGRHNTATLRILSESHENGETQPADNSLWHFVHQPTVRVTQDLQQQQPDNNDGREEDSLFYCPEEGCIKTYQTYNNLVAHMEAERHVYKSERLTLRDFSIKKYKELLEENPVGAQQLPLLQAAMNEIDEIDDGGNVPLNLGWALKGKKDQVRLSADQKSYLINIFNQGITTRKKADPKEVAKRMRFAKDASGASMFNPDQFLTTQQISSFFSRYAGLQRRLPVTASTTTTTSEPEMDISEETEMDISEETEMDDLDVIEGDAYLDEQHEIDDFADRAKDSVCFEERP